MSLFAACPHGNPLDGPCMECPNQIATPYARQSIPPAMTDRTDCVVPEGVVAVLTEFFHWEHEEYVRQAITAALSGYTLHRSGEVVAVPAEPTEAMVRAGLDEAGWHVEPYEAPRESGVETECGMSQEDADEINTKLAGEMRDIYRAMLSAAGERDDG